jgi:hypothetical protein
MDDLPPPTPSAELKPDADAVSVAAEACSVLDTDKIWLLLRPKK